MAEITNSLRVEEDDDLMECPFCNKIIPFSQMSHVEKCRNNKKVVFVNENAIFFYLSTLPEIYNIEHISILCRR